jgi:hypothetical protein
MYFLIALTVMNIVAISQFFQYSVATHRFPNEDPRGALTKLSWQMQVLPLVTLILIYGGLFAAARALNLLVMYQVLTGIVAVVLGIYNFTRFNDWNKTYGSPVAGVKVGGVPVTTIFISLVLLVGVAGFLIGLLKLPTIYFYFTFVVFLVLFVSLIVWGRRSVVKNRK